MRPGWIRQLLLVSRPQPSHACEEGAGEGPIAVRTTSLIGKDHQLNQMSA